MTTEALPPSADMLLATLSNEQSVADAAAAVLNARPGATAAPPSTEPSTPEPAPPGAPAIDPEEYVQRLFSGEPPAAPPTPSPPPAAPPEPQPKAPEAPVRVAALTAQIEREKAEFRRQIAERDSRIKALEERLAPLADVTPQTPSYEALARVAALRGQTPEDLFRQVNQDFLSGRTGPSEADRLKAQIEAMQQKLVSFEQAQSEARQTEQRTRLVQGVQQMIERDDGLRILRYSPGIEQQIAEAVWRGHQEGRAVDARQLAADVQASIVDAMTKVRADEAAWRLIEAKAATNGATSKAPPGNGEVHGAGAVDGPPTLRNADARSLPSSAAEALRMLDAGELDRLAAAEIQRASR